MTTTLWQVVATTPRSWVISRIEAPVLGPRSRSRSRMRAAVDTSSPVVGTAAIRRRGDRLAGARFAHQAQDLAVAHLEARAIDGFDLAEIGGEADRDVPELNDRVHRMPCIRGSMTAFIACRAYADRGSRAGCRRSG